MNFLPKQLPHLKCNNITYKKHSNAPGILHTLQTRHLHVSQKEVLRYLKSCPAIFRSALVYGQNFTLNPSWFTISLFIYLKNVHLTFVGFSFMLKGQKNAKGTIT